MTFDQQIPDYGDRMSVQKFLGFVKSGMFIDYDGYGHCIKDGKMAREHSSPSTADQIPSDITEFICHESIQFRPYNAPAIMKVCLECAMAGKLTEMLKESS